MRLPSSDHGRLLLLTALGLLAGIAATGCGSSSKPGGSSVRSAAFTGIPAGGTQVDVCLRVDQYQIAAGAFGNTDPITVWGYVQTGTGADCTFSSPDPATTVNSLSQPALSLSEGSYLVVHLQNNLPAGGYIEPVSITIPGQTFIGDENGLRGPTWTDGSTGPRTNYSQRVRSFTIDTAAGATRQYAFGPLKAGTYLYQSGTHPQVQVQMGLYGPLVVNPTTAGRAYPDPSSAYDDQVTLLFSEIDPVLHAAVAAGTYGPNPPDPAPAGWLTSTIDYHPKYFLVNGAPFISPGSARAVPRNARILLRFLNAGLDTKVPQLIVHVPPPPNGNQPPAPVDQHMRVIAEDGNFYAVTGTGASAGTSCAAPRAQYSAPLAAGRTTDAILVTPTTENTSIPIFDRRLHLTNNGVAGPGGQYALLATNATPGPALPAPTACALP